MTDFEFYPWAVLITVSIVSTLTFQWPVFGYGILGIAASVGWIIGRIWWVTRPSRKH